MPQGFKFFTRQEIITFLWGALSGLAFAPFHAWFLLIFGISGLSYFLNDEENRGKAFKLVWFWSFGLFLISLHWVSFSLGIDLEKFFWLLPLTILGLPAFLALIPALLCGPFLLFFSPGVGRWLGFAALWGIAEWVRGHWLFGGFPWNLIAFTWGNRPVLLQTLSFWGPYGLSVVSILLLTAPSLLLKKQLSWNQKILWSSVSILSLFGLIFWGSLRICPPQMIEGCWMRLVQPNVIQRHKWSPAFQGQHMEDLFELTQSPSSVKITHVLWPECALPTVLNSPDLRGYRLPLASDQTLLTGVLRLSYGRDQTKYPWNSVMIVDAVGTLKGCYDKSHLVPFGEYVPFRAFLSQFFDMGWVKRITYGDQDSVAGAGPQTLEVPGAPSVSALVCFDVVFPGEVVSPEGRPGWLLDVTNDAWFEDSWGLDQHFEMGIFRAVEEGLPLVRVANTGISGVIDPYGKRLDDLPKMTKLFHDFQLPQALPPTFYSRWREWPFWGIVFLLLWIGLAQKKGDAFGFRKRSKSSFSLRGRAGTQKIARKR